jgi:heptosyltransferase-2
VRGVNWLGDSVMTTPAMLRLRERFPRAHITLLTQHNLAQLWENHPAVDAVLTIAHAENPWSIGRRLRRQAFQAALIFPNSPRSALETWWARIPRRIGYAGPWRSRLLTDPIARPPACVAPRRLGSYEVKRLIVQANNANSPANAARFEHQMHDYLRLGAALGCSPVPVLPQLVVAQPEIEAALAYVRSLSKGIPSKGPSAPVWIGINPSAAYGPAKCWPIDRFAEVIRRLTDSIGNCIWLSFGAQADSHTAEQLAALANGSIVNLAGKTSLRQLMALLKICRVLLTNDSGPMHVAAALGTPVVAPFGSTSAHLTAPGQPGDPRHHLLTSNVPCSPCFRRTCPIDFRCMTSITVDQVLAAMLSILNHSSRPA